MAVSPLTYSVEARIVAPGHSELRAKQTTIPFDSSPRTSDVLPGPAELLCSAFAACLLKNVERFSEILSFRQEGASVRVTAERQQEPPRFVTIRYELRLATDEPQQRVDLLHRNLKNHGTVFNTLAEVCEVSGTVLADA